MTVRKRILKNGFTWEFCLTIQKNPRKQLRKSGFKTKTEAKSEEDKIISRMQMGKVCNDNSTFYALAKVFIEHSEKRFSKSTTYNYKNMLEIHLKEFWAYRTKDISYLMIEKWIDKKLTESSPYVTINCIKLCKAIYNYANSLNLVGINPFNKTKTIQLPKKIHGRLETEEALKLLETCKQHYPNLLPIIALGMFAGMRRGEILALKWSDIKNGMIKIQRQYTKNGIKEKLKTKESRRDIRMCETLRKILINHKKNQKLLTQFVFTNQNGGMVSLKTLHTQFKKLLELIGYNSDYMRFHDLRGTYVDISLQAGVPIKVIQKNVGHSKITTTMDIYSELLASVEDNAAILFEKNLNSVNIS